MNFKLPRQAKNLGGIIDFESQEEIQPSNKYNLTIESGDATINELTAHQPMVFQAFSRSPKNSTFNSNCDLREEIFKKKRNKRSKSTQPK